jgi:hypothetical protein
VILNRRCEDHFAIVCTRREMNLPSLSTIAGYTQLQTGTA